jgi:UDP-N-acetylmuramoyl-L-alanyl-D-glutamate--2,6-diaminopimelate ligase
VPAALRPERVPARPLAGLAALLGLRVAEQDLAAGGHAMVVSGITHDSRAVRPGDLYAALPGARFHGADFCAQAAQAGAVAVLTDHEGRDAAVRSGLPVLVVSDPRARLGEVAAWIYQQPSQRLLLIGVTGTSGKSTSSYLLESGLRMAGLQTGLIGGVQIKVGDELTDSGLTTPEATDLQALLALMVERKVGAAAMEVSSHALALHRVAGTRYDIAIFTNLSQDHLDFHADLDDYFAAKAELFTPKYSGAGVVNIDDPRGRQLAAEAGIPITTFSASGQRAADWRALDIRSGADGSTFRVIGPGGIEADASVALPGPFNVANALGVIVALVEAGIDLSVAVAGVAACTGVPGRLERVDGGQDFTVLVDYSHKPGAVEAVLTALRPVTQGSLMIVLGCGGDRDKGKRPMMGAAAAGLADAAIFTSDNPRSEDPLAILAEMLGGALEVPAARRAHVIIEPDRAAAIGLAVAVAAKGDVLVIAGKGHERGQYIGQAVIPFDDREVAAEALHRRRAAEDATITGVRRGASWYAGTSDTDVAVLPWEDDPPGRPAWPARGDEPPEPPGTAYPEDL